MDLSDGALMALVGFGGGLLLGLAARFGRFCTLGAIEDALYAHDWSRLRMWGLGLGVAIILTHVGAATGVVSIAGSIYAANGWDPLASIAGGLMFGYGMAMSGNCGYGALARLGGGDLRSFVVVVVMGVAAYMVIGGPLAPLRLAVFPPAPSPDGAFGAAAQIAAATGVPVLAVAAAIGGAILALALASAEFRRKRREIAWGVVVGLGIFSAWVGTTWVSDLSFGAEPIRSHSFTAPVGQSILYLMTGSGGGVNFGVGSVAGVLAGAMVGSIRRGHFRWEACDDPRELGRQIVGAFIMGVGGVISFGCSVGQGLSAFSALAWSAPVTLIAIFIGAAFGLRQLIEGLAWPRAR